MAHTYVCGKGDGWMKLHLQIYTRLRYKSAHIAFSILKVRQGTHTHTHTRRKQPTAALCAETEFRFLFPCFVPFKRLYS